MNGETSMAIHSMNVALALVISWLIVFLTAEKDF